MQQNLSTSPNKAGRQHEGNRPGQLRPPDVLKLGEIDTPEVGAGEVLVRVDAAGLDQGVWHLVTGLPYLMRLACYGLKQPKSPVLGLDLARVMKLLNATMSSLFGSTSDVSDTSVWRMW